jgi:hypothetical protein
MIEAGQAKIPTAFLPNYFNRSVASLSYLQERQGLERPAEDSFGL